MPNVRRDWSDFGNLAESPVEAIGWPWHVRVQHGDVLRTVLVQVIEDIVGHVSKATNQLSHAEQHQATSLAFETSNHSINCFFEVLFNRKLVHLASSFVL